MAVADKNKRIKSEVAKMKRAFSDLDNEKKKDIVNNLIDNIAFMTVTLQDLQQIINEVGCVEEYQNGENQRGFKESTAVRVYNSLIKNYNTVVKLALDQLGPGTAKDDALAAFMMKQ